jgi:hypothetical protein
VLVVLYGCASWSLKLREDRRQRVFVNRVLMTFGPKMDEVTGEWRRLLIEEVTSSVLLTKYWNDQIEKNEMDGACSMYGEKRCAYRDLVGTPEGKRRMEDAGVDVRIILKWIFSNWDGGID